MTPDRWISLLAIAVAVLGVTVPVILRRSDRQRAEIEKLLASNQILRDTNVDLKIQLMGLQRVGQVMDRTFSGLPSVPGSGEDVKP